MSVSYFVISVYNFRKEKLSLDEIILYRFNWQQILTSWTAQQFTFFDYVNGRGG